MPSGRLKSHELGLTKCGELDVVSIGAFGRAVARSLRHYQPRLQELNVSSPVMRAKEAIEGPFRGNSAVVVATSHPAAAVCELFAGVAHENECPFLPVVVDESTLRLGPIVVPGVGGCWRCFTARHRQHDSYPRETAALHAFYNHHPDSGPKGYLEPVAWIVASQIAAILSSRRDLDHWAGKIWQVDLFTRDVTTGELVGVDGCSWCGSNRPPRTRTYGEMLHSLIYLWNEGPISKCKDSEVRDNSVCEGDRK
jgi:bacteriocin biosynthesis cyclodehydratase domain-containing protein